MTPRTLLAAVVLSPLFAAAPSTRADDFDRDRAVLLEGVSAIGSPGVPGPLLVAGKTTFAVVTGNLGGAAAPVVAAGTLGRGRFVGFGHNGFFGDTSYDTPRLLANAVRWSADKPDARVFAPRNIVEMLNSTGLSAVETPRDWAARLTEVDVLCLSHGALSDDEQQAVESHLRNGGGVLFAGLGWGWLQVTPGKTIQQHPGNRLFAEHGLMWADGYMDDTVKDGFDAARPIPYEVNARQALDLLIKGESDAQALSKASQTLMLAARTLPINDRLLRPRLRDLAAEHAGSAVPTEQSPLRAGTQDLERLLLTYAIAEARALPPERVEAHAAAADFPGLPEAGATRVARDLTIDPTTRGWKSTGLYAEPGQVIVVHVPDAMADKGLGIRIGCHTDHLYDLDRWRRAPDISIQVAITEPVTRVASAFGGPIYLDLPDHASPESFDISIRNAVGAPMFVLGQTDPREWRDTIRHYPAPWAELVTNKVILSVPSSSIRDLEDPVALMEFWDRVLDAAADLAAIPRERTRPQRYVADRQISAGYMHSGYPIMTHLDASAPMTRIDQLRAGNWGLFHELGHNHQSGDWTFGGTGEVTCNLFSLYIIDTLCTVPPGQRGHDGATGDVGLDEYLAAGAPFEKWQRDPFLALRMYIQMQAEFGWKPFQQVFAEYRDLPRDQRPRSDAEKRDQWMVRFSRTVERNLGPFFEKWGIPTSQAARDSIADLPEWMPEELAEQP